MSWTLYIWIFRLSSRRFSTLFFPTGVIIRTTQIAGSFIILNTIVYGILFFTLVQGQAIFIPDLDASAGDTVIVKNVGAGTVTIVRNGLKIEGADQDGTLAATKAVQIVYVTTALGWKEI